MLSSDSPSVFSDPYCLALGSKLCRLLNRKSRVGGTKGETTMKAWWENTYLNYIKVKTELNKGSCNEEF